MRALGGRPRVPASVVPLAAGLGLQGLATYLFLVLAGRSLGAERFGEVSGLYLLLTGVATGLFVPLEQEVTARLGRGRAHGTWDPTLLRRSLGQGVVAAVVASAVAVAAAPLTLKLLGGDVQLLAALCVGVLGYAVWFALRGELAGRGRLTVYGVQLALEGVLRLAVAGVVVLAGVESAALMGWLLALSPWAAVALTAPAWLRHPHEHAEETGPSLTRHYYLLVASALSAQLLINAGPLVASLLATPATRDRVGAFLAALVVVRIPVFLFTAVQPGLLPLLAQHAAAGRRAEFTRLLTRVLKLVAGVSVLVALGAALLGPPVMRLLFSFDESLGRLVYLGLGVSVGLFLVATVLAQSLVSAERNAAVTRSWLFGLVGLAVGTLPGDDLVARATTGLLVGSAAACVALSLELRSTWRRWPSRRAAEPVGS